MHNIQWECVLQPELKNSVRIFNPIFWSKSEITLLLSVNYLHINALVITAKSH